MLSKFVILCGENPLSTNQWNETSLILNIKRTIKIKTI